MFGLIACSSENKTNVVEKKNVEIADDTIIGYLLHIDVQKQEIHLDISKWLNRDKSVSEDIRFAKTITYNESTIFQNEQGLDVQLENFKKGEKLAVVVAPSDISSESYEAVSISIGARHEYFNCL